MLNIITDYKWKNFLYGYELTKKERKELDYLNDEEIMVRSFIRYKNYVYDLGEFSRMLKVDEPIKMNGKKTKTRINWNYCHSDSFFSGIFIEVSDDGERYRIGTFYYSSDILEEIESPIIR